METARRRLPANREHMVCAACPSLAVPFGEFDVTEKPSRESAHAREHGYRIDRATQLPVCAPGPGRPPGGPAHNGGPPGSGVAPDPGYRTQILGKRPRLSI